MKKFYPCSIVYFTCDRREGGENVGDMGSNLCIVKEGGNIENSSQLFCTVLSELLTQLQARLWIKVMVASLMVGYRTLLRVMV